MLFHFFLEKKYHRQFETYIKNATIYEIVEVLGIGSYGVAYLLEHKETSEKVVLKHLRIKHKKNKKTRRRFAQEIEFLKRMGIPNIPSVISEGEFLHVPYYIMEFVDGQTFEELIFEEKQTFMLAETLHYAKQLLEIIQYVHSQGVVHQDIRIPNVLLKEGVLHIIDFGLAATIKHDICIEEIKNPKKTESYISDLYYVGHFLLYVLYSNYTPDHKKNKSWQEELELPSEVENFIEKLLLIQFPFGSVQEAYESMAQLLLEEG